MFETSSRDFLDWIWYLERRQKRGTVEHFYLAQIAAEVRRTIAKNPKAVKVNSFLVEYKPAVPVDPAAQMAASKAAWLAIANRRPKAPPRR